MRLTSSHEVADLFLLLPLEELFCARQLHVDRCSQIKENYGFGALEMIINAQSSRAPIGDRACGT